MDKDLVLVLKSESGLKKKREEYERVTAWRALRGTGALVFLTWVAYLLAKGQRRHGLRWPMEEEVNVNWSKEENLVDYVDILRGILPANRDFSHGNVLPLISKPRGMTHWSPQTTDDLNEAWYYTPGKVSLAGIRCTHQPSPWIEDYGQYLVSGSIADHGTPYFGRVTEASHKPYLFNATMANYCSDASCTRFEVSPSAHGGFFRFTFPKGLKAFRRSISISMLRSKGNIYLNRDSNSFHGYSSANTGGVINATVFKHYFSGTLEFLGTPRKDVESSISCTSTQCSGSFSWTQDVNGEDDVVQVRIGNSFISSDQAATARQRELETHRTLDSLVGETKRDWNKLLSRVEVEDEVSVDPETTFAKKQTLYTHLYRSLLFPRDLAEVDANGKEVHFSPYDPKGRVFPGPLSTDSGFWDAYRAVYPMLHLVFPDIARRVMKGWVNAAKEFGGRVPQWPSPGPKVSMVGTMSDVSMSEAIVNGAITDEEDLEVVYKALMLNAFKGSEKESRGDDLETYIKVGYFPLKVAETLNSKLADWAISRVAIHRGENETAQKLIDRAMAWRTIFDFQSGFFRPRDKQGGFINSFDEYEWNLNVYTEGGPWQYRFYVPFDGSGLREAYESIEGNGDIQGKTGSSGLCRSLRRAVEQAPAFRMSTVIHEATEMANNCFGQYAHNNQPSHHILYMFAHGGCAIDGQKWIQHTTSTLYGTFGYSGDEDNGEMSSWHILSSLGLYALVPGSGEYQIGAPPLFARTTIHRDSERVPGAGSLTILRKSLPTSPLFDQAGKSGPSYFTSKSALWNGNIINLDGDSAATIPYKQLLEGGTLEFLP